MDKPRTRRFKRKRRKRERQRHLVSISPVVRGMLDQLVEIHDCGSAPEIVRRLAEAELTRCREAASARGAVAQNLPPAP